MNGMPLLTIKSNCGTIYLHKKVNFHKTIFSHSFQNLQTKTMVYCFVHTTSHVIPSMTQISERGKVYLKLRKKKKKKSKSILIHTWSQCSCIVVGCQTHLVANNTVLDFCRIDDVETTLVAHNNAAQRNVVVAVSYTHLTLPTICSV